MDIAIVAIIGQLDLPYVVEWIDYHILNGVGKIFLFMNDWDASGEAELERLLKDYIGNNTVQLVKHFDGPRM